MSKPKIIHLIGSLDIGGTERILCTLVSQTAQQLSESRVITLINSGPLRETLTAQGIPVDTLSMHRSIPDPLAILRLASLFRRHRPDVVVTWLYHSNLIGGLASQLAGKIPVVWNIRHSVHQPKHTKRLTRFMAHWSGGLSRCLPAQIVYVAHSSATAHARWGYDPLRSRVIPNGFDVTTFRPDALARDAVRRELGIPIHSLLIGLFGRFHADKDHANFIQAAAQIHARRRDVHFLMCGTDITQSNQCLVDWLKRVGLRDRCHLLGPRIDMPRLTASLDIQVSSSITEAMPVVVGEAMACGVPCVVTDVGDSPFLVGSLGSVVPPRDSAALAEACLKLLALPATERQMLGAHGRQRIIDQFSLEQMVSQHWQLWSELADKQVELRSSSTPTCMRQAA